MPLKNRIKVHRAIQNWTQEELAERVGVTRKTINFIERGHFVPSTLLAMKIAHVFGAKVEDVFSMDEEELRLLELRKEK